MPMGGLNLHAQCQCSDSHNASGHSSSLVTSLSFRRRILTTIIVHKRLDPAFKRSVKSCGSSVQGFAGLTDEAPTGRRLHGSDSTPRHHASSRQPPPRLLRNLIQRPQRVPRRVCSLSKKFNKRPLPKPPPEDKYYIVLLTLIVTTLAFDNILTTTLQSPVLSTLTLVLNPRTPQAPHRRIYYLI
ncbi:unnamed protein product [Pleuronectes platessa]|uniref:Uncharacterized protein n=1 Tax=Pleuronectes platessa TaxID=8262 RepID=A0A9N7UB36_PLEPL|nr:unnamed protein product [Pleuronectes platessa]